MPDHRVVLLAAVLAACLVLSPASAQFTSGGVGDSGPGSTKQGGSQTGASGSGGGFGGTSTKGSSGGGTGSQADRSPGMVPALPPASTVFIGTDKDAGEDGVKVFGHFGSQVPPLILDREGYYAVRYLGQSPIVNWNGHYLNLESEVPPSGWERDSPGTPGRPVWGLLLAPRCDSYSFWVDKVDARAAFTLAARREICAEKEYQVVNPDPSYAPQKYNIDGGGARQHVGLAPPPGDAAPQVPGAPSGPSDDLASLEEDRCRALAQSFFETQDELARTEMRGHLVDCIDRVAAPGSGND